VYPPGPARASGGSGAVAMLTGELGSFTFQADSRLKNFSMHIGRGDVPAGAVAMLIGEPEMRSDTQSMLISELPVRVVFASSTPCCNACCRIHCWH